MHPYPATTDPSGARPRRHWGQLWIPAVFVVAALVATLLYANRSTGSPTAAKPDGTADRFYAGVNAHDRSTWSALLCDPGQAGKLSKLASVSLMSAAGPQVNGSSATAKGRFRLTTDVFLKEYRDYDFTVTLERANNAWCVVHLKSTPSKEAPTAPPTVPSPPTPTAPTTSSAPSAPAPTSSPPAAGGSCHLPSSARAAPTLAAPDPLKIALAGHFSAPALRWTLGAVSSYCYDGVEQFDLNLFLIVLGVSYDKTTGGKAGQIVYQAALSTTEPAHVVVTVDGSLKPDELAGGSGTGSMELDWYR